MKNNRRNFIKNIGIMGTTGLIMPNIALGNTQDNEIKSINKVRPKVLFF
ncbi:twin-arginine translocation signal domain-containing protein [uncultured Flavobacterium sp.]|tara:strand:+ start:54986 stop:55132 length:147 start_codon:yes stop_codon:yes gene_type:complete